MGKSEKNNFIRISATSANLVEIFSLFSKGRTMEENNELKAGHPPAQKVGGMRIVQHKHKDEKHEGSPPKVSEDEKDEFGEDKPVKAASSVIVSGAKVLKNQLFQLRPSSLFMKN